MQVDYLLGLDLGRNRDYSTLAVVEQTRQLDGANPSKSRYAVRHLRRWPLRTSYMAVVADLVEVVRRAPLCHPALVVDQTGVGQAVVDCLIGAQLAATVVPVTITGGRGRSRTDGTHWCVPKKELVFCLRGLLRSQRLQIAALLPEREALAHELMSFQVTITKAANETFAARSERDHDDLLVSVGLAAWWGEVSAGGGILRR